MKYGIRERIIGGVILIALAVIVVPMFFGSPSERQSGSGPTMTINQQPIEVPQRDIAPPQSELSASPDEGGDDTADLSQYAQLLPEESSSGNGATVAPEAAASASAAQQPPAATQQPSGAASTAAEPAPVTPAQAPPPARQTPPPQAQAPAPERATAAAQQSPAPSRSEPSSASQGSGSLASSDPIMAAANRHSGSGASASGGSAASAAAPSSGNWSVQAGSFGQSANADRLVEQLRGLGFTAYKISRGANSVVMVGPFQSSDAGESARQQLQQRANINGFVVRNSGNAG